MGSRIFVTGGAGYIGAVLVPMLLERGYQVRVLDRLYWGSDPLGPYLPHVELIEGDVRDLPKGVLDGVDAVVHLAGLSNDPTAEFAPVANWKMNAEATESLAQSCAAAGIQRFTFGSSCSVYDSLPAGIVYDEDAALTPRGAYAGSKAQAEVYLHQTTTPDFQPTILRQGTVYGASPRMRYDLVVNTFVRDAMRQGRLMLHGGGTMHRPLVDIRDVAEAHIACLEAPIEQVGGRTFNVLHRNLPIHAVADAVVQEFARRGKTVEVQHAPLPPIVREYQCANDRLPAATGFTPSRSLEQVLPELIALAEGPFGDFENPRYYNIDWMTPMRAEIESSVVARLADAVGGA
jgi:nucleoside-diphosphate-sugar epimerase